VFEGLVEALVEFDNFMEDVMTVTDLLHDFVLQLLRRGFTVAQVAQALADQKVKLMQADEYLAAARQQE
jgi:hypothetical protein